MKHIGRTSLVVTWPHVYGVSEFIDKYRVTLMPGGTWDTGRLSNEGDAKEWTFSGLAMNYPYAISVQAVNTPVGKPEAVGPPGTISVSTLPQWAEPPAQGIDGWTGSAYVAGRTNLRYNQSGIFDTVDNWAKAQIGGILAAGDPTVDRREGMTWIEFGINHAPELQILAVVMRAGDTWPE
jgi:hypothetical protein